MDNLHNIIKLVLSSLLFTIIIVAGVFLLPWQGVSWGKLEISSASQVSVTGEAKSQHKSQVATFNAGVFALNDNKDTAVSDVNSKMNVLIQAVKDFGIQEADIKTQNLSIYQTEQMLNGNEGQKTKLGQWRVSNDVTIKLRGIEKATELAELLARSGATNVYGPNFTLEDTFQAESGLTDAAMADAKAKAEVIAKASGRKLGKVINVSESNTTGVPVYAVRDSVSGEGVPLEPGSQTVTKTLSVIFELK